jgi:hypothetical protein
MVVCVLKWFQFTVNQGEAIRFARAEAGKQRAFGERFETAFRWWLVAFRN